MNTELKTPTSAQLLAFALVTAGAQVHSHKTIEDFMAEPEATVTITATDYKVSINVFHFLGRLDVDQVCDKFNAMPCPDWVGDQYYGVTQAQQDYLHRLGLHSLGENWNTGENDVAKTFLSRNLQGTYLTFDGDAPDYLLVQVEPVKGMGDTYTDAKLFRVNQVAYLAEDVILAFNDDDVVIFNPAQELNEQEKALMAAHVANPTSEFKVALLSNLQI